MALTHVLVVRQSYNLASDADFAAATAHWQERHAATFADVHVHRGVQSAAVYVYFELAVPAEWSIADRRAFETTLGTDGVLRNDGTTVTRLECVLDVPGASFGEQRMLHYVVETDAAAGSRDELLRWYDTEHMPGLARVPGCIRARRFINHDDGPFSYACYDLTRAGVTESPAWLAVRASPWSDRVRPQFRNTARTMFRELALPADG